MDSKESKPNQPSEIPVHSEVINFADIRPLNDPGCIHVWYRDDNVDIPGTHTELCRKCPVGRIVRD